MDRQKKLLIFGLAWLSAGLLTWFLYTRTVAPQQDKKVQVVVASRDLPLGTLLRKQDYDGYCLSESPATGDVLRVMRYYRMLFDELNRA